MTPERNVNEANHHLREVVCNMHDYCTALPIELDSEVCPVDVTVWTIGLREGEPGKTAPSFLSLHFTLKLLDTD